MGIENIFFILLLAAAVAMFTINMRKIRRNVLLGRNEDRTDNKAKRWETMARVAMGQSKMAARPVPFILHLFVYAGFVIINIEILEIVIDGILGTHRIFAPVLGRFYDFINGTFEILGLLVLIGVIIFMLRRTVVYVKRLWQNELDGWPRKDATIILVFEMVLMSAFLLMHAADQVLQARGVEHYVRAGSFPVSQFLIPLFEGFSSDTLVMLERGFWWIHIIGVLAFLNYLPISKHFHIVLAFPNTWYSNLKPKGQFTNMPQVTNEVRLMLDPSATPEEIQGPVKFGSKDVTDLSWKQLLDAYTCTECGRCTSECPANITGKKLSPRLIMMKTRDRLEEVGKNIDQNKGQFVDDGKSLLHDYITPEELWACTTCNGCVQACPVNIDPLSIILDLRRQLVMEESAPPAALSAMFTNIENNGAPWQFSPSDRLNWAE